MDTLITFELNREDQWINACSQLARIWRSKFEREFISFAVSINGLHVAHKKYEDQHQHKFQILGYRDRAEKIILKCTMAEAAGLHLEAQQFHYEAGIVLLYSFLEQSIRELFEAYYGSQPEALITGEEYKDLRKAWRATQAGTCTDADWKIQFAPRLEAWWAKASFSSIHSLFCDFVQKTKLEAPAWFESNKDPLEWIAPIKLFAIIRHTIIHRIEKMNAEMVSLLNRFEIQVPHEYKIGDPFVLRMEWIMLFESTLHQLFWAIENSLMCKGMKMKGLDPAGLTPLK